MLNFITVLLILGLTCPGPCLLGGREFAAANANGVLTLKRESSALSRSLDNESVQIIRKAQLINIYHLKAFVTEHDVQDREGRKFFADYEVLDVKTLIKKDRTRLRTVLLKEKNYFPTRFGNKCTFTATIGLEIISKSGQVSVIISLRCGSILFIHGGRETFRFVKTMAEIVRMAQRLFVGQLD